MEGVNKWKWVDFVMQRLNRGVMLIVGGVTLTFLHFVEKIFRY